jgi:hypothetical protein
MGVGTSSFTGHWQHGCKICNMSETVRPHVVPAPAGLSRWVEESSVALWLLRAFEERLRNAEYRNCLTGAAQPALEGEGGQGSGVR